MRTPERRRARVLGHPLDPLTRSEAADRVLALTAEERPSLVVTLNPEIIVRARSDAVLSAAIDASDLCVADGVGVAWAAGRAGVRVPERVPGVDLVGDVLARLGSGAPVYFLGGRPGVAERAARTATKRYGTEVAGTRDGYFGADEEPAVAAEVGASGARLLLAGLGERQEAFLHRHGERLGPVTGIGVGGTLDVLAGTVRRTPAWTRSLGVEWAWRVGLDPARWHRAPRLARFVVLAVRAPRDDAAPPDDGA